MNKGSKNVKKNGGDTELQEEGRTEKSKRRK